MGNVKLCDCTLSASELCFTGIELDHILGDLRDTCVDMIELGLACQRTFRNNPCLFYSADDIQAFREAHEKYFSDRITYSVLMDMERLPENFLEFDKSVLIRAQIWPEHYKDNLEVCRTMAKRGFCVAICLMETSMFSDSAFTQILGAATEMGATGVYIVDLDQLDVKKSLVRLKEANQMLPHEMALGYHGSDCIGEALETAKEVVGLGMDRTVLIDSSVCGLSKRAGKLRSEIFSDYLNETYGAGYNQNGFFSVYDHALSKRFKEVVLLRYLSAKYHCSCRYAEYYHNEIQTPLLACAEILRTMPNELRWDFSKKRAYRLFREYSKQQIDMAIIIPTCNRPKVIDNLLFQSAYQLRKYGIDIIIYDSSDDNKTETIVRNFQLEKCWNVFYHRYQGDFDGFSLDQKVMDAYKNYVDKYRYLWICRDGLIITPDTCVEKIMAYMKENVECIIVDAKFRNNNKESEAIYSQPDHCVDILREEGVRTTILGTFIFSSNLMKKILSTIPLDEKTYGLWLPAAPLHYYAIHPFLVARYIGDIFFYNEKGTPNSFWNKGGNAMEQWIYRWYMVVMGLPDCYNAAKESVLKIEMFDFHPFYLSSLMRMRGNGGLSIKTVQKYKRYIPFVSNTELWKFYAVSVMPKWFARFLVAHQGGRIFRSLRKVYLLICKKSV